jgi:hypothetical protein
MHTRATPAWSWLTATCGKAINPIFRRQKAESSFLQSQGTRNCYRFALRSSPGHCKQRHWKTLSGPRAWTVFKCCLLANDVSSITGPQTPLTKGSAFRFILTHNSTGGVSALHAGVTTVMCICSNCISHFQARDMHAAAAAAAARLGPRAHTPCVARKR